MASTSADIIDITYYTDPVCCWSWAMEPVIRKLEYCFKEELRIRYCMGGLIPSWNNFHDPVNSVSRPIQMGPVWMHASQLSGMKMDANLWFRDAPSSSYPACIAFKCVELQSAGLAGIYLRLLREACMLDGANVATTAVLVRIAKTLKARSPEFDVDIFEDDLVNGRGREAFRADLHEVKLKDFQRFPTWLFRRNGKPSIVISGYQPFEALKNIVFHLYPDIHFDDPTLQPSAYKEFWPFELTPREMEEAVTGP